MKAKLITYSSKGLTKTESSKLSKGLMGYTDKSNSSQYTYKRRGILGVTSRITVSKSTFIVPIEQSKEIVSYIKEKGGTVVSWDIDIPRKHFKN